jgi:hypothetical protein
MKKNGMHSIAVKLQPDPSKKFKNKKLLGRWGDVQGTAVSNITKYHWEPITTMCGLYLGFDMLLRLS